MRTLTSREEAALLDPEVRFGFDNYDVLRQVGELVRQMRSDASMSQSVLQAASGIDQSDISRLESGSLERGPTLLTLVRLAHAAGKRLVIGVADAGTDAGDAQEGASAPTARVLHL